MINRIESIHFFTITISTNMTIQKLVIILFLVSLSLSKSYTQEVHNVPKAFDQLSTSPILTTIANKLNVPSEKGHFQGVQVIEENDSQKLLISGSSLQTAYILEANLKTNKTSKVIPLMSAPFRHAGGIQVSEPFLAVGIEDNFAKTISKVSLYHYQKNNLSKAIPNLTINRKGEAKKQTAGSTGLLTWHNQYLMVVSNWDSRGWDFYSIAPQKKEQQLLYSFAAPFSYPSYQSINLIKDKKAIYAVGFYKKELVNYADLVLVSKAKDFKPIMQIIASKSFNCTEEVDFNAAAGLQVDKMGKLQIWATQKYTDSQIAINTFSQK